MRPCQSVILLPSTRDLLELFDHLVVILSFNKVQRYSPFSAISRRIFKKISLHLSLLFSLNSILRSNFSPMTQIHLTEAYFSSKNSTSRHFAFEFLTSSFLYNYFLSNAELLPKLHLWMSFMVFCLFSKYNWLSKWFYSILSKLWFQHAFKYDFGNPKSRFSSQQHQKLSYSYQQLRSGWGRSRKLRGVIELCWIFWKYR